MKIQIQNTIIDTKEQNYNEQLASVIRDWYDSYVWVTYLDAPEASDPQYIEGTPYRRIYTYYLDDDWCKGEDDIIERHLPQMKKIFAEDEEIINNLPATKAGKLEWAYKALYADGINSDLIAKMSDSEVLTAYDYEDYNDYNNYMSYMCCKYGI